MFTEDINPNKNDFSITNVNFKDWHFYDWLGDYKDPDHELYMRYLFHLSVCHTVVIEENQGVKTYNASSPDELALVNAAKFFGFEFSKWDEDNYVHVKYNDVT